MTTRTVVDVAGLRLVIAARRTALEHDARRETGRATVRDALRSQLVELDELEVLLEQHIAEHGTSDVTHVARPGVLLVGAGASGRAVVEADLEHMDPAGLTDRDLTVYTGLVRYVLERLEREGLERAYGRFPRRWVTGYVGPLGEALSATTQPAQEDRPA